MDEKGEVCSAEVLLNGLESQLEEVVSANYAFSIVLKTAKRCVE